ncbi:hypothetical protein H489_0101460 [Curtobacterium flaccumfaciens UCD-AKU]|nr:hypothetical protein H489_0101460 [Curtobacterium flaccumfaciens UCD-AKU]
MLRACSVTRCEVARTVQACDPAPSTQAATGPPTAHGAAGRPGAGARRELCTQLASRRENTNLAP